MCKIKCKECENNLIELSSVTKKRLCDGHINRFGDWTTYDEPIESVSIFKTLYCDECKEFYDYSDIVVQIRDTQMETISAQRAVKSLADTFYINPECIDFKTVKSVFEKLNVDFSDISKFMAHSIIERSKPSIVVEVDEVIPF